MDQETYERERAAEREQRITLLRAYRTRLAAAIVKLDVGKGVESGDVSLAELTAGIRMVTEQLRQESRGQSPAEAIAPPEPITPTDPLAGLKLFPRSA